MKTLKIIQTYSSYSTNILITNKFSNFTECLKILVSPVLKLIVVPLQFTNIEEFLSTKLQ